MIAPVLYFDESPCVTLEAGGRGGFERAPRQAGELVGIGDDAIDLGHRGEAGGVDRRGASRHHQLGMRAAAAGAADRGARFLDRRVRHRTAVHHDNVAGTEQRADAFAFGDVEPATERNHLGTGRRSEHDGASR